MITSIKLISSSTLLFECSQELRVKIIRIVSSMMVFVSLSLFLNTSHAIFINGLLSNPTETADFRQFDGPSTLTPDPLEVGGLVSESIIWSVTHDYAFIGNGRYGLGNNNGQWASGYDDLFRGIMRDINDIYAFRLRGCFTALDDVQFCHITSVPEPSTSLILGAGLSLIGIGSARIRKKL